MKKFLRFIVIVILLALGFLIIRKNNIPLEEPVVSSPTTWVISLVTWTEQTEKFRNRYASSLWFSILLPGNCYNQQTGDERYELKNLDFPLHYGDKAFECVIRDQAGIAKNVMEIRLQDYACDTESNNSSQQMTIGTNLFTFYSWNISTEDITMYCYKTVINNQTIRFVFVRGYEDYEQQILSSLLIK